MQDPKLSVYTRPREESHIAYRLSLTDIRPSRIPWLPQELDVALQTVILLAKNARYCGFLSFEVFKTPHLFPGQTLWSPFSSPHIE